MITTTIETGIVKTTLARTIEARATRMLDVLGLEPNAEVSLALVSDATIQELNKRYRKKNKPTDVLSFPLIELPTAEVFQAVASAQVLLGDVIVSVPTAERQAKERKRTLIDEITTLTAHGLLHLVGFDHNTDDEEREMDAYVRVLEAAAMNKKPVRLRLVAVAPVKAKPATKKPAAKATKKTAAKKTAAKKTAAR